MRNLVAAESILSLVTTPERAAAVAGDFTESRLGAGHFWWSVTRAAGAFLWKDLTTQPGRMAVLAGGGVVMQTVFWTPFALGTFLMAWAAGYLGGRLDISTEWLSTPIFALIVFAFVVPAPFLTGRWVARRAPGHELAPCLALTILAVLGWGTAAALAGQNISLMNGLSGIGPTLACLFVALVSLHAGAIWVRRHPAELRWFERVPYDRKPVVSYSRRNFGRIADCVLIIVLAELVLEQALGIYAYASLENLQAWLAALLTLVFFFYAGLGRPLGWLTMGRLRPAWLGKLLFAGMGALSAWMAWLAWLGVAG